jgi:hypothetical protein
LSSGVEYIYFVDDIFNYPRNLPKNSPTTATADLAVNWSAFINPRFITPRSGSVEAGVAPEFGTDSGSPVYWARQIIRGR